MRRILVFFFFLFLSFDVYAENNKIQELKNINLVKEMFSEFAEEANLSKLDLYYSKNFILESNGETYDYAAYKKIEEEIYQKINSLKVTRYDDIFACHDKVVSRMSIKLNYKNGKTIEYQLILIAQIKEGKIERIWEITYPSWSDKS